jgi:DNA-directed RNA polymerase subunit RPC12/RpoP
MALSITCQRCGVPIPIAERQLGGEVECPECRHTMAVDPRGGDLVRTSGFALASMLFGLAAGFTFVGPVLALGLGLVAYRQIAVSAGSVTGRGYATVGIVSALVCGFMSVFLFIRGDMAAIGHEFRDHFDREQIDYDGPLEVIERDRGFKITRPSSRWGRSHNPWRHGQGFDEYQLVQRERKLRIRILRDHNAVRLDDAMANAERGLRNMDDHRGRNRGRWRDLRFAAARALKGVGGENVREKTFEGDYSDRGGHRGIVRVYELNRQYFHVIAFGPEDLFREHEAEVRQALDSFQVLSGRRGDFRDF